MRVWLCEDESLHGLWVEQPFLSPSDAVNRREERGGLRAIPRPETDLVPVELLCFENGQIDLGDRVRTDGPPGIFLHLGVPVEVDRESISLDLHRTDLAAAEQA